MADIPLPWRAYAAHQSNLNSRVSVDATSWGMEQGLNYLLEGDDLAANTVEVGRVIASAARRDRYARSLLAKHIVIGAEVHNDAGKIEARSSLAHLQRRMSTDRLSLLVELAKGTDPAHLAASHRLAPGALRARIARARQVARDVAA